MREKSIYIPIHAGLPHHWKLRRLARVVGVSEAEAIGRLVMLWLATATLREGRLDGWTTDDFAAALRLESAVDASAWVDALINAQFLDVAPDGSLSVHEWSEYAGKSVEVIEANRERQKRYREQRAAASQQATPKPSPQPESDDVIASFERALEERRSRKT